MLKIWDNWPRMQWYDNNKNFFHCHQLHLHDASKGMQQEFEYCCYHQRFLQIFLAILENFLTITVSENVNGSSSSTVSLRSDQPVGTKKLLFPLLSLSLEFLLELHKNGESGSKIQRSNGSKSIQSHNLWFKFYWIFFGFSFSSQNLEPEIIYAGYI